MLEATWVSLVIGIAAFVQSCAGFGFALISVPVLALFLDLKVAVPLTVFYSVLLCVPLSFIMRQDIQKKAVLFLTLGTTPGMFIGVEFLKRAKPEYVLVFMGFILFFYCAYELLKRKTTFINFNSFATMFIGLISGILGASVGESGPPIVVYASAQNWTSDQIKSTILCFFSIQMAGILMVYIFDGMYHKQIMELGINTFPAFVVGGLLGLLTYRSIKSNQVTYHRIIYSMLMLNGVYIFFSNIVKVI